MKRHLKTVKNGVFRYLTTVIQGKIPHFRGGEFDFEFGHQ